MKSVLNKIIEKDNVKFIITKVEGCYDYTSISSAIDKDMQKEKIDKLMYHAIDCAVSFCKVQGSRQTTSGKCTAMKRYGEWYVRHSNGDMIFVFKQI